MKYDSFYRGTILHFILVDNVAYDVNLSARVYELPVNTSSMRTEPHYELQELPDQHIYEYPKFNPYEEAVSM